MFMVMTGGANGIVLHTLFLIQSQFDHSPEAGAPQLRMAYKPHENNRYIYICSIQHADL